MTDYTTKEDISGFFDLYPHPVLMLDCEDKIIYKNYLAREIDLALQAVLNL